MLLFIMPGGNACPQAYVSAWKLVILGSGILMR